MPGIKKNISDFLELDLEDKNDKKTKISKEKTIKFLLRDFLLKENLSLKYKKILDNDYKKFEKFFKNYKKNISSLISNQKRI